MNRLYSTTIGHTPTIIGLSFNLNEFWSSSKLDFVQTFWTQCVQESSGSRSTNNQVTSVSEIISAEHIVNSFMAETASVVGYPRLLSPLFTLNVSKQNVYNPLLWEDMRIILRYYVFIQLNLRLSILMINRFMAMDMWHYAWFIHIVTCDFTEKYYFADF